MTAKRLKDIQKSINPFIIFLSETKNSDDFVLWKLDSLGFCNNHIVPPTETRGGGLALFWNEGVVIDVLASCKNFIDTRVQYEGKSFLATFIYEDTDYTKRKMMWQELSEINEARGGAWYLTVTSMTC